MIAGSVCGQLMNAAPAAAASSTCQTETMVAPPTTAASPSAARSRGMLARPAGLSAGMDRTDTEDWMSARATASSSPAVMPRKTQMSGTCRRRVGSHRAGCRHAQSQVLTTGGSKYLISPIPFPRIGNLEHRGSV
jgi:hypothetical protein